MKKLENLKNKKKTFNYAASISQNQIIKKKKSTTAKNL